MVTSCVRLPGHSPDCCTDFSSQSRWRNHHYLEWRYRVVQLQHWGQDKMAHILQPIFSNVFSSKKMLVIWKFNWSWTLRVHLTISQHWFTYWLGRHQAFTWTNDDPVYWCMCISVSTVITSAAIMVLILDQDKKILVFHRDKKSIIHIISVTDIIEDALYMYFHYS